MYAAIPNSDPSALEARPIHTRQHTSPVDESRQSSHFQRDATPPVSRSPDSVCLHREMTPPLDQRHDPAPRNRKSNTHRRDVEPAKWGIHWKAPVLMVGLLIAGIAIAVGHHILNSHFDGTPVHSPAEGASKFITQKWIGRYGTALAFAAKTTLAGTVGVAYKQHIWTKFRSRPYTIEGMNAMHSATSDAFAFLNWDFLKHAKLATVLALITWSLPLSALITPSTLTVVPDMKNITTSMAVPTLNLSDSSRYVFPGLPGGVSPLLTRTTVATASLGDILPMDAVLPNSTYTHVFNGSSLVCEPAKGRDLTVLDGVSNNLIDMLSQSQVRLSFLAYPCGTLMRPGADTDFQPFVQMVIIGSMAGGSNPGTYAAPTNYTFMHVRSGNGSLACKIQKTKYTTRFAASGDKQIATNTSVEVLGDVDSDNDVATALAQALMDILGGAIYAVSLAEFSIEGDCSGSTLYTINTRIMETNLIGLVDTSLTNDDDRPKCLADPSFTTLPTPTTKPAIPWPSVMNATTGPQKRSPAADAPSPIPLSSVPFIPGLGPGVALVPGSTVPQSPDSISPADQALARNMSLASLIEELSRNLTLSLFSTSRLWTDAGTVTEIDQTVSYNKYMYLAHNLVLAYGIAIFVSLLSVVVGLRALQVNGVSHDTSFYTIMATTRNIKLDDLLKGESLGASPIPGSIAKKKLQFGVIAMGDGSGRGAETVLGSTSSTHTDYSGDTMAEDASRHAQESVEVMGTAVMHACFGLQGQGTSLKKGQTVF